MKLKFTFLLTLILLTISSCTKEQQSQFLPYINITVNNQSFKIDSVIAVYDDSAGIMSLRGIRYSGGVLANSIAIGFKFSTGTQAPKTYDATRTPIEMIAIYKDSTGVYSTATLDSLRNPANPIGTGILNLTSHNLSLHTIAGNFELRPKEIDPETWQPKTRVIQISGSFQTYYVFLTRGYTPPIPMKVLPMLHSSSVK